MVESFIIRDAVIADIPALATLHVKTWNETHGKSNHSPIYQVRESQWRQTFGDNDSIWFCLVIENNNKQLIGFAKGMKYDHSDLPGYSGELNKIYLLREYQRLGLGRRLIGHVARHFLSLGIHSMVLFGTAQNPSCAFYEALGGQRLYGKKGEFNGGYGWKYLQYLASIPA